MTHEHKHLSLYGVECLSSEQQSDQWLNEGTQRIGTVGNVLEVLSRHVVPVWYD
jgi:hypothetical protein